MPTTEELLDRFTREYVQYNQISTKRARAQRKLLLEFGLRLGRPLGAATRDDLQSFAGELLARGLHVNTVRAYLNLIRPFYSWAYAARVIDADTYLSLKSVADPRGSSNASKPRPYTPEQLAEMYGILGERFPRLPERGTGSKALERWLVGSRWRIGLYRHAMGLQLEAIIALALHCGLRNHEIFQLTPDLLHYDLRYIVVSGKRVDHRPKIREVPFTEQTRTVVRGWLDFRSLFRPEHDRTWLALNARHLGQPWSLRRFQTILSTALGPGWELHRLRHTCGTEWLRAGMDLEDVSKLLGHSKLQQTLAYAEIAKSDVERAMQTHEAAFMERISNRAA